MDTELQHAFDAFAANDYTMARAIFLKKFTAGAPEVGLALGWMLQMGLGGPCDCTQAREIYASMLPSEDGVVEYHLGCLLLKDRATLDEALSHLAYAAGKGNPSAAYWVYAAKSDDADALCAAAPGDAQAWLESAARAGHLYAKRDLIKQEWLRTSGLLNHFRQFRSLRAVAREIQSLRSSDPNDLRIR